MISLLRSITIVICLMICSGPVSAEIFTLSGTFYADLISGPDITGIIHPGDPVSVEAFYDTNQATLLATLPYASTYGFPAGSAGIRFTVDGLVWETVGAMSVSVVPVERSALYPDGTIAASWGGPIWLGITNSSQVVEYGGIPTTMHSPFGNETGLGKAMTFGPTFPSELFPTNDLPTNLTLAQLGGPNFAQGAAFGTGPSGDYFFNFTSPIPEPQIYLSLFVGLGLLAFKVKDSAKQFLV